MENKNAALDIRQQLLVKISAYASLSDVDGSKEVFDQALDAGLSINEIKEALVHLYAYTGFPPSILGLNSFKQIVDERRENGKKDNEGKQNSPVSTAGTRYDRGEKAQMIVTGLPAETLKELFAFAPVMDVFLKEHLFADLFDRDVLSFIDRELVTVAALAALHHPFVRSHIGGALNVEVTRGQLLALFDIIESEIGKTQADTSRKVLEEVVTARLNA